MRGLRANLDAAGGGTYLIFPLVKLILGPPHPDNYCTVPDLKSGLQMNSFAATKQVV